MAKKKKAAKRRQPPKIPRKKTATRAARRGGDGGDIPILDLLRRIEALERWQDEIEGSEAD